MECARNAGRIWRGERSLILDICRCMKIPLHAGFLSGKISLSRTSVPKTRHFERVFDCRADYKPDSVAARGRAGTIIHLDP